MLDYKFCNTLIPGDGISGMRLLDAESIPLVVTSPPFGSIREYGGHPFYFEPMARELWRVIMPGGVVCWHIQEQIVDGGESGDSARQRLLFQQLGFRLHQTLVIDGGKVGKQPNRYGVSPQYVFVLSKGNPRTFNPIVDIPNKYPGRVSRYQERGANGMIRSRGKVRAAAYRKRDEIWRYATGTHNTPDIDARTHPALMPEKLAADLICSWSRDEELVVDPMSGAGTTAKMAFLNNRRYLGFEIHREYHELAVARLKKAVESLLPDSPKTQGTRKLGVRVASDATPDACG